MIDRKFRIFGKVSILDILLVVLAVVALYVAAQFSAPQTVGAKPGDVRIRYTAELYKKTPDFFENIKVGEKVYDIEKNYEIGTVVDVYQAPYMEEAPDFKNGVIKRAAIDGLIYIYVVIEADAQITDSATMVGQYEVMVGKECFIRTKDFSSSAYFIKLERLD